MSKIWFPAAVIAFAAIQTFGMDMARMSRIRDMAPSENSDTVIYDNRNIFVKFRKSGEKVVADSIPPADSLFSEDTSAALSARDTIHAPDSLKETDPFRYKYYVALVDSLTHKQVRDSLRVAGDSLDWPRLDSLYYADSAALAKKKFQEWYDSLDKTARKKYDFEQKMKRQQQAMDSLFQIKDSLNAIRDSIRENTPRILSTYAIPDSMQFKRIISWNRDNNFSRVVLREVDTSYNYYFNDYPFMRNDVNASYLGIIGSPVQTYDFFRRKSVEGVSFYTPYETYSFSPSTLPMYNTKTPYTELAYWGTLFANAEREESDIHILTTQNIFPSLNITLSYDRVGANGMLQREDTDNRTFTASANYMGKRYLAHAGYIYNKMSKSENGGVVDNFWIRDTTVGSREIAVHLANAENLIKKNTVFLDQTYRIPFTFLKNLGKKKRMQEAAAKDGAEAGGVAAAEGIGDVSAEGAAEAATETTLSVSTEATGEAAAKADKAKEAAGRGAEAVSEGKAAGGTGGGPGIAGTGGKAGRSGSGQEGENTQDSSAADTLDTDVTTAFIGHSSEYSVYRKIYKDNIPTSNAEARKFYTNYFLNPAVSMDSLRVMKLENRIFLKLQPWSDDAIVSTLSAGLGNRILSYYMFTPDSYLSKPSDNLWNSLYVYGGAGGQLGKTLLWNATGYYTFLGDEINDAGISADARLNLYPFRRHRKNPVSISAHFETSVEEPEFYEQNYFSNHFAWKNDFSKISFTKLEGSISIPHVRFRVEAGYSLLANNIYYGTDAIVRQNTSPMSVARLGLRKDFSFWGFHLDNQALLQVSSNENVMPLPAAALNLKWYYQFDVVKNVMQMQLGANALYTTKWYVPAYNPALGQFHNQTAEKYGNCPYFDVFLNVQWKRACIFVKLLNAGMGWPMPSADYFSAAGYIRPQRAVKFGIFWPFYLQPGRNASVSGRAGSSVGGGGGGLGGGLGGGASSLMGGLSGMGGM